MYTHYQDLDVAYTEVDIRHSSMPPSSSALVTQGNDFANVSLLSPEV